MQSNHIAQYFMKIQMFQILLPMIFHDNLSNYEYIHLSSNIFKFLWQTEQEGGGGGGGMVALSHLSPWTCLWVKSTLKLFL